VSAKGLADTGALLALLDRDDRWHTRCTDAFRELPLPLATSAAVLAELFHLLGDAARDRAAGSGLLRSGAITVLPIDDGDLDELDGLMAKYADRSMDFADATLVRLAQRERLSLIFTIDHADFNTYRIDGRRRFRNVPER
jgi:predicted nucleic acid-binding protein